MKTPSIHLIILIISQFVVTKGKAPNASVTMFSITMIGGDMATREGHFCTFVKTVKDGRRHLVAAAVARCVSIFGMYPVGAFFP